MRVKLYEREDREETLRYITQNWLYNLKRTIEEEESKRGRMPFVSLSLSLPENGEGIFPGTGTLPGK